VDVLQAGLLLFVGRSTKLKKDDTFVGAECKKRGDSIPGRPENPARTGSGDSA
jgi:hypothetical protein